MKPEHILVRDRPRVSAETAAAEFRRLLDVGVRDIDVIMVLAERAWMPTDVLGLRGGRPPRKPSRKPPAIRHGTDRGWYQHREQRKPLCERCRVAHTVAQRSASLRHEHDRLVAAGVDTTTAAVLAEHRHLNRQEPTP